MVTRGLLVGLLLGVLGVGLSAQGPYSAEIQSALRNFVVQPNTWTGTQTFTNVVINGTCTGCGSSTDATLSFSDITTNNSSTSKHGFLAKLSGNAYDTLLGDGTWGHTWVRGSIAVSDPFIFSQTWNAGGVNFKAFQINITRTASNNGSCGLEVFQGATRMFAVCDDGGGSMYATAFHHVNIENGTGLVSVGNDTTANQNNYIYFAPKTGVSMVVGLRTPTCSAGCGGSPTIGGNSSLGTLTLGTAPSATTIVMNWGFTFPAIPQCTVYHKTNNVYLAWATTTTQLTITGTFLAGDELRWQCFAPW